MNIDAILAGCLVNDNAVRKEAEEAFKSLALKPEVVPELLQRMQHAPNPEIRHLAAVLLRKRITRLWTHLSPEVRRGTQGLLLQQIGGEPVHGVRRAVADVAAVIAKYSLPRGEWPELLGVLHQWSQGASADHREVALLLFASLAEVIGEALAPALLPLIAVISSGLADASPHVRTAALRAVEPLVGLVEGGGEAEVVAFHGLVAALMECARRGAGGGAEEDVVRVCQLLVDCVEVAAPLVAPHLAALVTLCTDLGVAQSLELETREQALQVVSWVARYKPKQLAKNKAALHKAVDALCMMACEEAEGGEAVEDDAAALTPRSMAAQVLDTLALHLPSQHVLPQVLAFAATAALSQKVAIRCGGLTAVAVMAEGCNEALGKRLPDVLPLVLQGMKDPDRSVRGAAAFAMGQMAEFMAHNVVEHYAEVLPVVLGVMGDPDASVQERGCYALDTFCEAMEPEQIAPYMPKLIEVLVAVLAHGSHKGAAGVQEMALSALASIAAAARTDFEPHLPAVLPALNHFMGVQGAELLPCRCRATECMGLLMESLAATPGSALGPLVPGVMAAGLSGWGLGASELREYTHSMWACIAKAIGSSFAPYLATVVPLAFTSLEQDEGTLGSSSDEDEEEAGSNASPGGKDLLDEASEEGDARARALSVRSGVMDEKCAALQALGFYAQHCCGAGPGGEQGFEVHLPRAIALAKECASGFHEDLRTQAYEAMGRLLAATHRAYPPPAGSPPGTVSPSTQAALALVGEELCGALEDDDCGVVGSALGAWKEVLTVLGGAPLAPFAQKISEGVAAVLTGNAPCCEVYEEEEGEEGEEGDEEGGDALEDVVAAACDLLPALAGAAGADTYAPVFASQHMPALLSRLKPRTPEGLRGIVVGGIAEVAERMQAHMVPHLPALIPLLTRELRGEDPINRQNAAFACGVLFEGCGAAAVAQYVPQVLQALHPLFGPKEAAGTRDNAVGCVARLLLSAAAAAPPHGGGLVPLGAVLPVYCAALPPKEDWGEAHVAYRALCEMVLADATAADIAANVPAMVRAFGAAAVHPKTPAATRAMVTSTVAMLRARYQAHIDPLLAGLPADQQAAFAG